jgi:tungstate transport system substrate-binding protein
MIVKRIASLALALLVSCRADQARSVTIATTTSLDGSGLLQVLRTEFQRQTGIELNAFVIGSGQALRLATEGKVDMTITHDPDAERVFVAQTRPELYRQFMWNDFIIVGPAEDPAGVSRAHSASEAFRRIHRSQSKFLSRGDQSGTHMKELSLWRSAAVSPRANPNYLPIGQPMAHLLRSASELQAYALTDRATYDRLADTLGIRILFSNDPALRNTYAVILMRRSDSAEHRNARRLADWILSSDGKRVVESFRIAGRQEFHWIGK